MLVRKTISFKSLFQFAGFHLVWLLAYMTLIAGLYQLLGGRWVPIPWLPVSLIGTAVAFYLGFKNNQSYDRMWEARKIWGAIVNSSRSWGAMVNSFVVNTKNQDPNLDGIKARLIYRHIAWLYTLREQLLVPTQWEHVSLGRHFGSINVKRREDLGIGQYKDFLNETQKERYFADKAYWEKAANGATQIIEMQSRHLAELKERKMLTLFHQIELQKVLNEFYDHQGKAERIKKFPFPRQYANMSFIFNAVFIFLLPLGMVGEFAKLGDAGPWLMVPFAAIVGWIYIVMELIGDYSENPFEGLMNDIPMLSLCRTIEIDLLQMLGETELPKPIQPKKDVLM